MTELRLRYQTVEFGKTDIHVCTLRDNQEFYDPDGVAEALGISSATWPLFGVIWPSGLVLAHHMAGYDFSGKRILEVGCGMALSSLLLNKLGADITATDYHPEAERFLNRNTLLNADHDIPFEKMDWADIGDKAEKLGTFDLIIGSDVLYEAEHTSLLSEFIQSSAKAQCEVIIVDPGRGHKNKLSQKLENSGFSLQQITPGAPPNANETFKGQILIYNR